MQTTLFPSDSWSDIIQELEKIPAAARGSITWQMLFNENGPEGVISLEYEDPGSTTKRPGCIAESYGYDVPLKTAKDAAKKLIERYRELKQ